MLSRFDLSLFSFGFLKERVEYDYISIDFSSFCNKCNSFWILCKFWCCKPRSVLEVVKIYILGVCWAKGSVFLEGFKVTSLVVLCVICIWFPNEFWGLDVALGLRVNQYKLFLYLFLPLNSFKFSCCWFAGINNRLFRRNKRFFFWCFACFLANLIPKLVSCKEFHSSLKSFRKPSLNNSPPV